jgi:hypothetical protein
MELKPTNAKHQNTEKMKQTTIRGKSTKSTPGVIDSSQGLSSF